MMGKFNWKDLKPGTTIECVDAEDAIEVMKELAMLDIETDFRYELGGKQGLWLEVIDWEEEKWN